MDREISGAGRALVLAGLLWMVPLLADFPAQAQLAQPADAPAAHQSAEDQALSDRLGKVLAAVDALQKQLDDAQQQIADLRTELKNTEEQLQTANNASSASAANALQHSMRQLQEDGAVLQAEVAQHEQSKVETASKYPLTVSGMVLFSSFLNDGAVDDVHQPAIALVRNSSYAHGSLTATARQSAFGLEAWGPHLWSGKSAADLNVDFFGGMGETYDTPSAGILRLRTMHAGLEWPQSSLRVEIDKPLIAPLEPTSLLSYAQPAMAWAGNLWIWVPQLAWSRETAAGSGTFNLQLGLMDAAAPGNASSAGLRQPNAAEQNRLPAFESHVTYTLPLAGNTLEFGAGGFYGRQRYSYGGELDAWAGTADFRLPLTRFVEASGALYRGRAVSGLGGAFQNYLVDSDDDSIRGLDAEGGWAQVKGRLSRRLDVNAAIGETNGYANELEYAYPDLTDTYGNLARNRTSFGNIIYRPSSYLLFSAEYRNLRSWPISGSVYASQAFGLGAGYLF